MKIRQSAAPWGRLIILGKGLAEDDADIGRPVEVPRDGSNLGNGNTSLLGDGIYVSSWRMGIRLCGVGVLGTPDCSGESADEGWGG